MSFLSKIFGDANARIVRDLGPVVERINELEPEVQQLSDAALREKTAEFKQRLLKGEALDDLLPEAFAAAREASRRTLGQRHFDVQLVGGIALHQGKIAEMRTGEGKTLTATLAIYLNALQGQGAHVVTVNDYLARRDAVWMGQIYHALGLSIGVINHEQSFLYDPAYRVEKGGEEKSGERDEARDLLGSFRVEQDYLRPVPRREAYAADITYGTNNEFGFDYLRDNMVYNLAQMAQRGHHYAIVDEVDSILIDEARTPLIISAPDTESSKLYEQFARVVPRLEKDADYKVDEKYRAVTLTEEGIAKVEKILGIGNIYEEGRVREVHALEQALRAFALFRRDKEYVVKDGQIVIVDEFTGRLMPGRRYSEGLHQAIEAKEGVRVQEESRTLATITFQNYFRLYRKLAGMTGTAATNAEEFHKVYKLEVLTIPTNKPMIRKDVPDAVFKNERGKFLALAREVKTRHELGQPVLIGTVSIEKNEYLSSLLKREGVPHEVLNAKNHEREGAIIAQAGRLGAVTVATNMAGRGVDIILGGNPPNAGGAERVKELGGLHVIGTERHEARRIDNQLRGRSGRQGDTGSSQFFVSLEDDLMRIFGGERIKGLMERLGVPDDEPIQNRMVSRAIEQAQSRIEGYNFDIRKHVLEYDEVMNKHREVVYRKRREILEIAEGTTGEGSATLVLPMVERAIGEAVAAYRSLFSEETGAQNSRAFLEAIAKILPLTPELTRKLSEAAGAGLPDPEGLEAELVEYARATYEAREQQMGPEDVRRSECLVMLQIVDMLWMEHLETMEHLRDSVRLRAYGQRDPLIEYKNEGHRLFGQLLAAFETMVAQTVYKIGAVEPHPAVFSAAREERRPMFAPGSPQGQAASGMRQSAALRETTAPVRKAEVGRNDPCPCGAKHPDGRPKKYKHCHGK